jgi:hypothetical protein
MKVYLTYVSLIVTVMLFSQTDLSLQERIERYSGENSKELLSILESEEGDTLKYTQFILENCSSNDLAVLTKEYLLSNVEYAIKAKEFTYSSQYSEEIFRHFVLPHRVSQEPLEDYRKQFYEELKPLVADVDDIEKAAVLVNLWASEQMTFKQTSGRDQGPVTTIKRGYGRCEEMMIIYIAAARSVGIPARPASVSYWNFTDNNHAWVEIWTPEGWKYTGGAEPANTLNKAWFKNTTKRATLVTSEAFGNYNSKNTIKQENNMTYISSIGYYTDFEYCNIRVSTSGGTPVDEANVSLYATSYGGLFPLTTMETSKNGEVSIPLGKGTVFVTAFKDNKFGHSILNTMENSETLITLTDEKTIDKQFDFLFPIPFSDPEDEEVNEIPEDKFKLMRENADLKRKNRLSNLKKSNDFAKYYDLAKDAAVKSSLYFDDRKSFLDKADELAENSPQYLHVLQKNEADSLKTKILVNMLMDWDIKDLIEVPDSTEINDIVDIYQSGKLRFQDSIPDSLFFENVIGRTWRSAVPQENGWWRKLSDKTGELANDDINITVQNVIDWVDTHVEVDSSFIWTYFSGSVNPIDILNMKHIPEFYRTKLMNSILKQLGIPLQWKGRLEYYNSVEFVAVENIQEEEKKDYEAEVTITIFADGEQIKAEPFTNFLISGLDEDGTISYIFFEGTNDSLVYKAKYRRQDDDNIYIESFIRNSNGDANVVVRTIDQADKEVIINLLTPKEYLDATGKWNEKTKKNVMNIISKIDTKKKKILFVRGEIQNEPEERMLTQISAKSDQFKDSEIIVYTENRKNNDLSEHKFILKNGKKIITDEIPENEYPIIFVLDEKNEIIFSSVGYNMGIVDLLLKKIK